MCSWINCSPTSWTMRMYWKLNCISTPNKPYFKGATLKNNLESSNVSITFKIGVTIQQFLSRHPSFFLYYLYFIIKGPKKNLGGGDFKKKKTLNFRTCILPKCLSPKAPNLRGSPSQQNHAKSQHGTDGIQKRQEKQEANASPKGV